MFYHTVILWGVQLVPWPFFFTSCLIRKTSLVAYLSGTGKTRLLGVGYVDCAIFVPWNLSENVLKLGPCAIWKARSSCDHRRCIRKNVHDLLGTYFNNIQAEDAPSSPHFSKGSWGNGVNQIFWIIKGGNELTLLQCSCWSSRCFRPLAGEHPTRSVWLENPKSGMLTFAAQTDKLNLTGYIPSCRRQSL